MKNLTNHLNMTPKVQGSSEQLKDLKKAIYHLESRLEKSDERLIQVAKASKDRLSRMQSSITKLEFLFKSHSEETREAFTKLKTEKIKNTSFYEKVKRHLIDQDNFNKKIEDYFSSIKKQMNQL